MYSPDFFTVRASAIHPRKLVITTSVFSESNEDILIISTMVNNFNELVKQTAKSKNVDWLKLPDPNEDINKITISPHNRNQLKLSGISQSLTAFVSWLENPGEMIRHPTTESIIRKIDAAEKQRQESRSKAKPLAI